MSSSVRGSKSRSGDEAASAASYSTASDGFARAVLDHDDVLEQRHLRRDLVHERREAALVDESHEVRVVEDVAELVRCVAVVDVDRDGPELERREHRLDELDRVEGVDPDVRAGRDAVGGEVVGQAVRALFELRVGVPFAIANDGRPVGDEVDRVLDQVGDVESHARELEHVSVRTDNGTRRAIARPARPVEGALDQSPSFFTMVWTSRLPL